MLKIQGGGWEGPRGREGVCAAAANWGIWRGGGIFFWGAEMSSKLWITVTVLAVPRINATVTALGGNPRELSS